MTSSDIASYDQDLDSAIDGLQLSRACTNKLSPSQVENMKTNVVLANEAIATAGNAVRASAGALYEIKKDVKNKNWTALTESGALQMSGRMARDLVKAYESWIRDSDVPDEALARVSARVLARIGSVDAGKRTHAINKIKRGEGYTEQDLTKIIGNTKSPVRRQIDDLVAQAEKKIKASTNEDKINQFEKLIMENVNLEGKLEKQKELNNELQQQNKKLDKNNKELIKLLHQAATEGVSPASVNEAAAALV
ncbi:hypothetical protein [Prochlorococcus marinus]|uniref:Uncharacterized protein n=1 Tax=Prochlorococcus marinus (strain MIT 9303) TaxID=59922 RepID=A2CBR7_PROM3|nr:hypothetical protein [Prochlorococcus marinus]ABM78927.1 Hypothetical protein P9303_21921 [Prochlorococcus marinus str. MIT 9303]